MTEHQQRRIVGGIHLSGPNSARTSLAIASVSNQSISILKVYEKIGSLGSLFSDDRIFELVRSHSLSTVAVDCPLSVPPCVRCTRVVCPGTQACEDTGVAYLLAVAEKIRKRRRIGRRGRPIHPQNLRVWDVLRLYQEQQYGVDPSFSAHSAPQVIRAQTLQKRLKSLATPPALIETFIPLLVSSIGEYLQMDREVVNQYRNFEEGKAIRKKLVERLFASELCRSMVDEIDFATPENFKALLATVVAGLYENGLTSEAPSDYLEEESWVYLPELGKMPALSIANVSELKCTLDNKFS